MNYAIWKGTLPCDVLFIGEAPDISSDSIGLPYVGPTGRVFNDILVRVHHQLKRHIVWCVTYAVRCATPEFRSLHKGEANTCSSNLASFITLAKPLIIVTMGEVAKVQTPDIKLVWPEKLLGERVTPPAFPLRIVEYRWTPIRTHVKGITWIAKQSDYELAIKQVADQIANTISGYGVPF